MTVTGSSSNVAGYTITLNGGRISRSNNEQIANPLSLVVQSGGVVDLKGRSESVATLAINSNGRVLADGDTAAAAIRTSKWRCCRVVVGDGGRSGL